MNNQLLHIIFFLFALVLFSCASENNDKKVSTTPAESTIMKNAVTTEVFTELEEPNAELTSEQLKAFELRAIQKFEDFTDYVAIISNPKVKHDLVNHSLILVQDLFINDSIFLSDSLLINHFTLVSNKEPYRQYLIDLLKLESVSAREPKITIQTKFINFLVPLTKDSINNYFGIMDASIMINGKKSIEKIDVHLLKIQKKFGDSIQDIMEVRLGNIY
jgi:hypothetical protein